MNANFHDKFCAQYGVGPEEYDAAMLWRSLYPAGKILHLFVRGSAEHFSPDRDFVRGVGRLSRLADFESEVWAFTRNPRNGSFLRRRLRMRVSAKKVYQLMREVMEPTAPPPPDGSAGPFITNARSG